MIKRYPHKAAIIFSQETESADGITTAEADSDELVIDCRYEARDSASGKYSAKVFTPVVNLEAFEGDGVKLSMLGRTFDVMKISLHQTHSEIWLK